MVWNDIAVVVEQGGMTAPESDLTETERRLLIDVAATLGATHKPVVLELADNVRALDLDDRSTKCVDDVQQYFHDTFVDTTWPSCPRHPNHPLEYSEGFWCCPRDNSRITRLGELSMRPNVRG